MKTLLTLILLALVAIAPAATITLAWDANPEPDIAGYELSYGGSSRVYTSARNAGNNTSFEVLDLVPGQTYYFAVSAYNTQGLKSPFSNEISYRLPAPNAKGWLVNFVDDEQADGYGAELAIDGDSNTFWHTVWREGQPQTPLPHELQIDMGVEKTVGGFTYLPRQDNYEASNIKDFDFYVSLNGIDWSAPVASGTFSQGKTLITTSFPAKACRYFRLVARSTHSGASSVSVAELSVVESSVPVPPTAPARLKRVLKIQTSSNLKDWVPEGEYDVRPLPDGTYPPQQFFRVTAAIVTQP